ncbi:MAG TPA: hypothetical protein VKX17_13765 [Planctomycetota bacterium]|nr:hypothetical protein [Planctomycetota bacterium]
MAKIPPFDSNSVLPPHLGDPTCGDQVSPYPCTSQELCERFSTSPERIKILGGFLRLRTELRKCGMTLGFQWLDGSFLEDVENIEAREPKDIDVVTFYWHADPAFSTNLLAAFPDLANPGKIRTDYFVDHYVVDAGYHPAGTVAQTSYWYGLFSHTRPGVWKGMLRVDLDTQSDDTEAMKVLVARSTPPIILAPTHDETRK